MKLKTPKELGITLTQFKNLCKLVTFVRTSVPPPDFDIRTYCRLPSGEANVNPVEVKYECGTTACFCGYGPLAGVKPHRYEDWWEYKVRVFGARDYDPIYFLLFDEDHINCKDAAVRRGAYFLAHGIPVSNRLRTWEAPDNFRPPFKLIAKHAQ